MADSLYAGSRLLGLLTVTGMDYPRIYASFAPAEGFEAVRNLFVSHDMAALASMDALDLRLVSSDGRFDERLSMIIIDGDQAMWRVGFLRSTRTARHDEFWGCLGPEVGPDRCRAEACDHLVILYSVFCRRHHFRMIMHEEYDGSEGV